MQIRKIKKYKNRKLYDLKASKYVTLSDIASMLLDGEDITISGLDGEDFTREVLFDAMASQIRGIIPADRIKALLMEYAYGELDNPAILPADNKDLMSSELSNVGSPVNAGLLDQLISAD